MARSSHAHPSAGHAPSLVAALAHLEVSFMVWALLGALGAYVAGDLGLTSAQKGLMVAVPALGGSLSRVVVGALADRFGLKRVGLVSLGLILAPLAWGAWAGGTFPQVLAIGLLLGVAGASFSVALPLAGCWYPPRLQGLVLGIVGAGNSGTVVTSLVAPRLAEHHGWHAVFALAALPVLGAWLVVAVLAKEPPRPAPSRSSPLRLLAQGEARALCATYAVTFGGYVGLVAYLPILIVDGFGTSKVAAATLAALGAACGSLLRPLGGWLADRHGSQPVVGAALGGAAALLAMASVGTGLAATSVPLMGVLAALGTANGAVFQVVPQLFPARMGAATGLVGAAGGLGGFFLPLGLGALHAATGSFSLGFLTFAAVVAAAWVFHKRRLDAPSSLAAARCDDDPVLVA